MPQRLSDDSRTRLDGIVQRMEDAGEPEDAIRFVVSDFKSKYALPDRPVSAEDFTPRGKGWPATIGDIVSGGVKALASGAKGAAKLGYHATVEPLLHPLRPMSESPLAEDVRGIVGAQDEQFRRASEAFGQGRVSEGIGRTVAGAVPFIGPAAAQAGEKIGAGDAEGIGEALVLAGAPLAGRMAPAVGRTASAAGRGAVRAGEAIGRAAKSPVLGPVALDIAASSLGGAPVFTMAKALKAVLEQSKKAEKGAPDAVGPPINPNAGGAIRRGPDGKPVVVRPAEAEIAAMLDEVAQPTPLPPPARITTPPQPDLPPGYTPRATVPKPRVVKPEPVARAEARAAERKAAKRPDTTIGQRGYFLRREPVAEAVPLSPAGAGMGELPTSWRNRTDQPIVRVTKAQVEQFVAQLKESGIDPADAMRTVTRDPHMAPETRMQLMTALGRAAKGR